jgi:pimeloyl-ACP methyl ester carboxylesterase
LVSRSPIRRICHDGDVADPIGAEIANAAGVAGAAGVRMKIVLVLWLSLLLPMSSFAKDMQPLGIALENWAYPYPVAFLELTVQGQSLRQAYMDVPPDGKANGRVALLLHGRNFPSSYWQDVIAGLSADGYRVVATDQIGFGKSSKPGLPASFDQLARNTVALLDKLAIAKVDLIGHSMGGMLAVRFTRTYPGKVRRLVLEAPIGLEDYRFSVPPVTDEQLIRQQYAETAETYRAFLKVGYALDLPDSAIEPFVDMIERLQLSGEYPRWVTAFVASYQMIHDQPVVHEYPLVATPTLFIMGANDHNAPGRAFAPPELAKRMGFNVAHAQAIAAQMPNAKVLVFDGVGHIPHMERPQRFMQALEEFLDAP